MKVAPPDGYRPRHASVGKSNLAQALVHEACRRGYDVLFMPAAGALAQLAAGRPKGRECMADGPVDGNSPHDDRQAVLWASVRAA